MEQFDMETQTVSILMMNIKITHLSELYHVQKGGKMAGFKKKHLFVSFSQFNFFLVFS